ncbi:MAG: TonB-dependent receptor [Opitutus sp.]|nr:TonB-dependent receptor [Opitutus sp.]
MNSPPRSLFATHRWLLVAAAYSCIALHAPAQVAPATTASLTGRVQNAATGQYLNNARVSIKGTNLLAFTDESGTYRIDRLPAGNVVLEVFYTGLDSQQIPLTLAAAAQEKDIALAPPSRAGAVGEVVKLSSFVVSDSREMDGAAIAINEQRFAPNIVSVVSADEFGLVPDGNIGEFLKLLPGITMSYRGGDPREVSIDGVGSESVPVTVGGFSLATPEVSGTGRNVELNSVSINNMSRVEAVFSPTPESPGSALAGTINLVPRSAFERSKPVFTGSTYVIMRDNARDFNKTPGPRAERTRKVQPGFEFTWIVPLSKSLGFTLSGGASSQYSSEPIMTNTWRGAGAATNGGTLPDTTPDRPYLSDYLVRDSTTGRDRTSLGLTIDYRLTPHDRLSYSFQYGTFHSYYNQRNMTFIVNRVLPGEFSPTFTHGFAGAGEVRQNNNARDRLSRTVMPSVTFRHDGPIWKVESGFGLSQATNQFRDADKGYLSTSLVRRTGVTVSFDDIFYLRPGRITIADGVTGAPVDPYNLSNYALSTTGVNLGRSVSRHRTAFGNIRRDFFGRWPLSLKAGVDLRQSMSDYRTLTSSLTYLGADGRASTTPVGSDDSAGIFLDRDISTRIGPYGFPQIQWLSNEGLWDFYQANPGRFSLDQNAQYRSEITNSKHSEELISAIYLRGDLRLLDRRLNLTGGVRAEQTNIKAEGPLTDQTRNYQRDAAGRVILGANGRPLTIASDALTISRLTFIDRGKHAAKEYLRLIPSLNASYQVRANLIARAAYYHSLGRPDFNQYSGALTLPDVESPPSTINRITVNNVGIKAWQAKSSKVTLEYYFERVGQLSVGAFRRDFENFFGSTVIDATPEFLALYGLDPGLYDPYTVSTNHNLSTRVRMKGYNVNYRQALTFLPHWARGIQFYANGSAQRATGDGAAEFAGYFLRSGSWGISLSRPIYNLRLNWNYLGRQRRGVVNGRSIEAGTYNWGSKRSYIDVSGEYSLTRRLALFANLRNINQPVDDVEITGPTTPEYAQLRQRQDFGSLWTIGVKGSF